MWQQRRSKVTLTSCGYLDIFCEKTFLQRKVFFSITRRRDLTVKLFWDINHLLSCLRIYWASYPLIERENALSSKFLSCSHCTLRIFLLGRVLFVYHASTKGLREIKIVFCSVEVSTINKYNKYINKDFIYRGGHVTAEKLTNLWPSKNLWPTEKLFLRFCWKQLAMMYDKIFFFQRAVFLSRFPR